MQSLYETWFIALYTVLYTAAPIMCVAFFEQVTVEEMDVFMNKKNNNKIKK